MTKIKKAVCGHECCCCAKWPKNWPKEIYQMVSPRRKMLFGGRFGTDRCLQVEVALPPYCHIINDDGRLT